PTRGAIYNKVGGSRTIPGAWTLVRASSDTRTLEAMVNVGDVLWQPSPEWIEQSNLQAFRRFLKERHGLEFNDLQALRRWSVEHLEDFWQGVWDFFHIQSSTPPRAVLGRRE